MDWRADRIGSALRGENPTALRRLDAGFAVIGDVQFLPGYCVLLAASPGVERLTDCRAAGSTSRSSATQRGSRRNWRAGPRGRTRASTGQPRSAHGTTGRGPRAELVAEPGQLRGREP
jgi:hypothetical protein